MGNMATNCACSASTQVIVCVLYHSTGCAAQPVMYSTAVHQGVVTQYTAVDSPATGIKMDGYFGYMNVHGYKHVCMSAHGS